MSTTPSEPEPDKAPFGQPGRDDEPTGPAPRDAQERDELESLRRRVEQLEDSGAAAGPRHRLRSFGSALVIFLASVLALLSVVAVWAADVVGDTDRYVASVAPLASNPDVQNAITDRVTAAVLSQIDIPGLVAQLSGAVSQRGVPPRASNLVSGLTKPITEGLTQLVSTTVHGVVTSSAFATVWVNANRTAHAAMVKALTGEGGGAIQLQNNQVVVDVGPIVAQVKDRLVASGFAAAARIPPVQTTFVIFSSQDIGTVRNAFRLLQIMGNWLPVITVLIAAGGVFLALNRRRALIGTALGVAAAMLVLGIALTLFRDFYVDRLPPGTNQAAAAAVYDAIIVFLRSSIRAVGALALVTAFGAFIIGPSRIAVSTRHGSSAAVVALRSAAQSAGYRSGPVGRFVHRYKRWIGAVILAAAALTLFLWDHPTTAVIIWLAVIVLALFAIREFLDDDAARAGGDASAHAA
jgi:hypothetical protein